MTFSKYLNTLADVFLLNRDTWPLMYRYLDLYSDESFHGLMHSDPVLDIAASHWRERPHQIHYGVMDEVYTALSEYCDWHDLACGRV